MKNVFSMIFFILLILVLCISCTAHLSPPKEIVESVTNAELEVKDTISSIMVQSFYLDPAFDPDITDYTVIVPYDIQEVSIRAEIEESKFVSPQLSINGSPARSNEPTAISRLEVGDNTVDVNISIDKDTWITYKVTVKRELCKNAEIADMLITGAALTPEYNKNVTDYFISVEDTVNEIGIKLIGGHDPATYSIDGVDLTDDVMEQTLTLNKGDNLFLIGVTAMNGTKTEYTINVTRKYNNDCYLSNLSVSAGILEPAFEPETKLYRIEVQNNVDSFSVTPVTSQETSSIFVNDLTADTGVATDPVSLPVGQTIIPVRVRSEEGTEKIYTLRVIRNASSNTYLSDITISQGTLTPAFDKDVTYYTVKVDHEVDGVTLKPTISDSTSTILVNGSQIASDTSTDLIPVGFQENFIILNVTAEDGAIKNYFVVVNRTATAELTDLVVHESPIEFKPDVNHYDIRIPVAIEAVTIQPFAADSQASININDKPIISGESFTLNTNLGDNYARISITGRDNKTTRSYTIKVLRGFIVDPPLGDNEAELGDSYGYSIDLDNNLLVIGIPDKDIPRDSTTDPFANDGGAVYVFRYTNGEWAQEEKLTPKLQSDDDNYGHAVAVHNDLIVVGAPNEDSAYYEVLPGDGVPNNDDKEDSGACFVYRYINGFWQQTACLKPTNCNTGALFGYSVDIHNETIAVGSFFEASSSNTIINGEHASNDTSAPASGAVYVFKKNVEGWYQDAYLKGSVTELGDCMGISTAIYNNTIVTGAFCDDSDKTSVFAPLAGADNNNATDSGAVYVFKEGEDSNWYQHAYIKASNTNKLDYFGYSIAIDMDTIVVGAQQEASAQKTISNGLAGSIDNSAKDAGAVYVFRASEDTWIEEAYIKPSNLEAGDKFGTSVGIHKNRIVVGAIEEDSGQNFISNGTVASNDNEKENSGACYVFERSGVEWSQIAYLKANDPIEHDEFGFAVDIYDETIVVSAIKKDTIFEDTGMVYLFSTK